MGSLTGRRRPAAGGLVLATLIALLVGCGSSTKGAAGAPEASCPATVMTTLAHVAARIYHEGVASERTEVARRLIAASAPLRLAVEARDPAAAAAAARALVAGGHITDLRLAIGGHTLAAVGKPALAPFGGVIQSATGQPLATYTTSVWSDEGFLAESQGVVEGRVALRRGTRSVGGSLALPGGRLAPAGELTTGHVAYRYVGFGATAYPSGDHLRVYVLRSVASTAPLCGADAEQSTVNTLTRVARLIYAGEAGARTKTQVRRVQRDTQLLEAVARHDPAATRAAVTPLLNQHIVRLRVLARSGALLADVGGPYVLAPVAAPLRLGRHTIGSFVLSIQDDEGYLRLTKRLAGLRVLMYMQVNGQPTLVKNSLGPGVGGRESAPASGRYEYGGHTYSVFTLTATAFPSGPLTIRVLIPIPYS